jgi:hypothetical protein
MAAGSPPTSPEPPPGCCPGEGHFSIPDLRFADVVDDLVRGR